MPQVAKPEIKERAARLRAKGDASLTSYLEAQQGTETEILIEQDGVGRTAQFAEVLVEPAAHVGTFTKVRISDHDGRRLRGGVVA